MTRPAGRPRPSRQSTQLAALVSLLLGSTAATAQQAPVTSGHLAAGVRGVSVSGAHTKYREDINLDDGPRLFDLGFNYANADPAAGISRVEFAATNLGGDPFENLRFNASKYGRFEFRLSRNHSEYFYEDVILPPELASITGSTGGDFHHFDFERIRDRVNLDFNLTPATTLSLDMERFSRLGDGTTTIDIQRDEFEIEREIDEALATLRLGLQHRWNRITLIAEQEIGDYENGSAWLLPGYSAGSDPDNFAELLSFQAEQPWRFESAAQLLRLLARPTDRVEINVGARHGTVDLDLDATSTGLGTGYAGAPWSEELTGSGMIANDHDLLTADLAVTATPRVRLLLSLRERSLAQAGMAALGDASGESVWQIDTRQLETGVELAVGPHMLLSMGYSDEAREVLHAAAQAAGGSAVALLPDAEATDRAGWFMAFSYDPEGPLAVNLTLEDNRIDDPYALASPTSGQRLRAGVRYQFDNGLGLQGSWRRQDLRNDLSGWLGDSEQWQLRLSWQSERLRLSAGHAAVDLERRIDQLVTGGSTTALFPIDFLAASDFSDATWQWQPTPALEFGGFLRDYGNQGSRPSGRDDWRTHLRIDLGNQYQFELSFRAVDYRADAWDHFSARIIEAAIGYRW